MALVRLLNGKGLEVSHEQGNAVWGVLRGELEGDDKQRKFCETVQNVYLNRYSDDLPASYVRERTAIWERMDAGKRPVGSPLKERMRKETNDLTEWINQK